MTSRSGKRTAVSTPCEMVSIPEKHHFIVRRDVRFQAREKIAQRLVVAVNVPNRVGGHDASLDGVTNEDATDDRRSYEYGSAARPEQYYGDAHWDPAWPELQRRFGTRPASTMAP